MMKMKKIVALTVLFMFLLSSVCMAVTPDPDRWVWIDSNNEIGLFYDKKTIKYDDGGDTCDVWIMTIEPAKYEYTLAHKIFNRNREWRLLALATYSMETNEVLQSATGSYYKVYEIPPGSIIEVVYDHLFYGR